MEWARRACNGSGLVVAGPVALPAAPSQCIPGAGRRFVRHPGCLPSRCRWAQTPSGPITIVTVTIGDTWGDPTVSHAWITVS